MKRKKTKQLIRIWIILLVILIVLTSIVIYLKHSDEEAVNTPAMSVEERDKFFEENKVLTYKNLTKVSSIDGLTASQVIEKVEKVVTNYIPNLYNNIKDYNDEQLRNYYDQYKNDINENIAINTQEEFIKLVNNLKKLKTEMDLYDYCEYLEEDSKFNLDDKYSLAFCVYYRNGKSFKFYMNIDKNV